MLGSERRFGIYDLRERVTDGIYAGLRCVFYEGANLQRQQRLARIVVNIVPEIGIILETGLPSAPIRIEPLAGAFADHLVGCGNIEGFGKHLQCLGKAAMRPRMEIVSPLSVVRPAFAVPMFIQVADALCRLLSQSNGEGDLRATIAARFHEGSRSFHLMGADVENALGAFQQRLLRQRVRGGVTRRFRDIRPIRDFGHALGGDVVAAEDVGHARRIAGTPRILHQHGMIKGGLVLIRQRDLRRDSHGDKTGTLRVSHRLPAGKVQRITE